MPSLSHTSSSPNLRPPIPSSSKSPSSLKPPTPTPTPTHPHPLPTPTQSLLSLFLSLTPSQSLPTSPLTNLLLSSGIPDTPPSLRPQIYRILLLRLVSVVRGDWEGELGRKRRGYYEVVEGVMGGVVSMGREEGREDGDGEGDGDGDGWDEEREGDLTMMDIEGRKKRRNGNGNGMGVGEGEGEGEESKSIATTESSSVVLRPPSPTDPLSPRDVHLLSIAKDIHRTQLALSFFTTLISPHPSSPLTPPSMASVKSVANRRAIFDRLEKIAPELGDEEVVGGLRIRRRIEKKREKDKKLGKRGTVKRKGTIKSGDGSGSVSARGDGNGNGKRRLLDDYDKRYSISTESSGFTSASGTSGSNPFRDNTNPTSIASPTDVEDRVASPSPASATTPGGSIGPAGGGGTRPPSMDSTALRNHSALVRRLGMASIDEDTIASMTTEDDGPNSSRSRRRAHRRRQTVDELTSLGDESGLGLESGLGEEAEDEEKRDPAEQVDAHWEALERILYVYAVVNPGVGYVQGMNELLSPLYFILARDPEPISAAHAEADAFWCFSGLMAEVRDLFVKSLDGDVEGLSSAWTGAGGRGNQTTAGRIGKEKTGIGFTLRKFALQLKWLDPKLSASLEEKGVKPSFYAFRWLTTMLSQEFQLPDLIRIWDAIFALVHASSENSGSLSPPLEFLIDICCAMVLREKDRLLNSNFAVCMGVLQRPNPDEVEQLLELALEIRERRMLASLESNGPPEDSDEEFEPVNFLDERPQTSTFAETFKSNLNLTAGRISEAAQRFKTSDKSSFLGKGGYSDIDFPDNWSVASDALDDGVDNASAATAPAYFGAGSRRGPASDAGSSASGAEIVKQKAAGAFAAWRNSDAAAQFQKSATNWGFAASNLWKDQTEGSSTSSRARSVSPTKSLASTWNSWISGGNEKPVGKRDSINVSDPPFRPPGSWNSQNPSGTTLHDGPLGRHSMFPSAGSSASSSPRHSQSAFGVDRSESPNRRDSQFSLAGILPNTPLGHSIKSFGSKTPDSGSSTKSGPKPLLLGSAAMRRPGSGLDSITPPSRASVRAPSPRLSPSPRSNATIDSGLSPSRSPSMRASARHNRTASFNPPTENPVRASTLASLSYGHTRSRSANPSPDSSPILQDGKLPSHPIPNSPSPHRNQAVRALTVTLTPDTPPAPPTPTPPHAPATLARPPPSPITEDLGSSSMSHRVKEELEAVQVPVPDQHESKAEIPPVAHQEPPPLPQPAQAEQAAEPIQEIARDQTPVLEPESEVQEAIVKPDLEETTPDAPSPPVSTNETVVEEESSKAGRRRGFTLENVPASKFRRNAVGHNTSISSTRSGGSSRPTTPVSSAGSRGTPSPTGSMSKASPSSRSRAGTGASDLSSSSRTTPVRKALGSVNSSYGSTTTTPRLPRSLAIRTDTTAATTTPTSSSSRGNTSVTPTKKSSSSSSSKPALQVKAESLSSSRTDGEQEETTTTMAPSPLGRARRVMTKRGTTGGRNLSLSTNNLERGGTSSSDITTSSPMTATPNNSSIPSRTGSIKRLKSERDDNAVITPTSAAPRVRVHTRTGSQKHGNGSGSVSSISSVSSRVTPKSSLRMGSKPSTTTEKEEREKEKERPSSETAFDELFDAYT